MLQHLYKSTYVQGVLTQRRTFLPYARHLNFQFGKEYFIFFIITRSETIHWLTIIT